MLIVPIEKGNNIERTLRKFKRKFEKVGVAKEVRRRRYYQKPTVRKRLELAKAIYIEKTYGTKTLR